MHVQDLALNDGLLAHALLASVFVTNDLSLALTVGAHRLEPLDHWPHLAHHGFHATAVTAGALLNRTLLATETAAFGADDGLLESELGDFALVDILEADLVDVCNRTGLLGAGVAGHSPTEHASEATSAATEELGEKVFCGHATCAAGTLLKTLLAILVVDLSFLRIGEDFVCVG